MSSETPESSSDNPVTTPENMESDAKLMKEFTDFVEGMLDARLKGHDPDATIISSAYGFLNIYREKLDPEVYVRIKDKRTQLAAAAQGE